MRQSELKPYRSYEILCDAAERLVRRKTEIIDIMVAETGFTTADCTADFTRTLETLQISGEEAKRIAGE